NLFRHAHSIKGMAAAMGYTPMSALSHAMEDLLHRWRDGTLTPDPASIAVLMQANDRLSAQLDAVAAGGDLPSGDSIRDALRVLAAPGGAGAAADGAAPSAAGRAPLPVAEAARAGGDEAADP